MAEYKAVTFNEGAPLDPKALNDLQTSVTTAYSQSMNVVNSSGGEKYVPVIDCGRETVEAGAGKNGTKPITFNESFTDMSKVSISATIANGLGTGEQVTVTVTGLSSTPTIHVSSSLKTARTYTVHWIAVQKKSV